MPFSKEVRKQILKRAGWKSEVSGDGGKIEAAHIDHSRDNPKYDTPENGISMTIFEHLVDHVTRHGKNGLPPHQNEWAAKKILFRFLGVEDEEEKHD